jgi:hypothetical protein
VPSSEFQGFDTFEVHNENASSKLNEEEDEEEIPSNSNLSYQDDDELDISEFTSIKFPDVRSIRDYVDTVFSP